VVFVEFYLTRVKECLDPKPRNEADTVPCAMSFHQENQSIQMEGFCLPGMIFVLESTEKIQLVAGVVLACDQAIFDSAIEEKTAREEDHVIGNQITSRR
jgi:hypothetical protein